MIAKQISNDVEIHSALVARKKVFVDELAWVNSKTEYETDRYDIIAKHFGVFEDDKIFAYVRAIKGEHFSQFMLFKEFRPLLTEKVYAELTNLSTREKMQSIELSRLFVDKNLRNKNLTDILFKKVNEWAFPKHYVKWYAVMTDELYKMLISQGYVIKFLSKGSFTKDAPDCIVGYVDLIKTKDSLSKANPQAHNWFFQEK